jgi:hypothetical protein
LIRKILDLESAKQNTNPKPIAKIQTMTQAAHPAATCVDHEVWNRPVRIATIKWQLQQR